MISDKELDELAVALEDADEFAHRVEFMNSSKIPCNECGGAGRVAAGSLGDMICPTCQGTRTVDHPGSYSSGVHPAILRIGQMRRRFVKYAQLRLRAKTHPVSRMELSAAEADLPSVDEVDSVCRQVSQKSLGRGPGSLRRFLRASPEAAGGNRCRNCHERVADGSRFCGSCGADMMAEAGGYRRLEEDEDDWG